MSGGESFKHGFDAGGDRFAIPREKMIDNQLRRRGVNDAAVLQVMRAIPRHHFVAPELRQSAYDDQALPSQDGQTISQPYMVGIMTQELAVRPGMGILEIGTGTGYQTAILAYLAGPNGRVSSIERLPALAQTARDHLEMLGLQNAQVIVADGSLGWPAVGSEIPRFDRILLTAGAPHVPDPLLDQLADGGILVAPIGDSESQMLTRVTRHGDQFETTPLFACRFVPLVGQHGWNGPA
jgi:protein-L-isoaspartate(D-aspartate) O-methyltransferase